MIRYANSGLRFLLELGSLAALCAWGLQASDNLAVRIVLGIGAPLVAATAWGLFVAPKARLWLRVAGRVAVEAAFFGSAVLALAATGRGGLATSLGVLGLVNTALVHHWRQDEHARAAAICDPTSG